uniref:Uncharacterized protein n=1 Tax=Chlorobium chlorochromatii (strain CaD3) TaxID=340177 RepID=Q3ARX0_CHLCH
MEISLLQVVIDEHVAVFGVEPVFTGWSAFLSEDEIATNVCAAIDKGEPYVEEEVPDGVDI